SSGLSPHPVMAIPPTTTNEPTTTAIVRLINVLLR
ncbi:uncharacterized protein METZ01_LOCUS223038, partial [marine metagenome]